jgi:hypothetical protein
MHMIAVYALPQGVPVAAIELGGIGQPFNPPPIPGCLQVFIGSDSEGKFGHNCPACGGYWRSGPWSNVCPYCGIRAEGFQFLSAAQQRYVQEYCKVLAQALHSDKDGETVIDMDAVADAVGKEGEKPAFYMSDESQQRKFTCGACDEFNDILGRFGYCSRCGTRNDLTDFKEQTAPAIRKRLNSGDSAAQQRYVQEYCKVLAQACLIRFFCGANRKGTSEVSNDRPPKATAVDPSISRSRRYTVNAP